MRSISLTWLRQNRKEAKKGSKDPLRQVGGVEILASDFEDNMPSELDIFGKLSNLPHAEWVPVLRSFVDRVRSNERLVRLIRRHENQWKILLSSFCTAIAHVSDCKVRIDGQVRSMKYDLMLSSVDALVIIDLGVLQTSKHVDDPSLRASRNVIHLACLNNLNYYRSHILAYYLESLLRSTKISLFPDWKMETKQEHKSHDEKKKSRRNPNPTLHPFPCLAQAFWGNLELIFHAVVGVVFAESLSCAFCFDTCVTGFVFGRMVRDASALVTTGMFAALISQEHTDRMLKSKNLCGTRGKRKMLKKRRESMRVLRELFYATNELMYRAVRALQKKNLKSKPNSPSTAGAPKVSLFVESFCGLEGANSARREVVNRLTASLLRVPDFFHLRPDQVRGSLRKALRSLQKRFIVASRMTKADHMGSVTKTRTNTSSLQSFSNGGMVSVVCGSLKWSNKGIGSAKDDAYADYNTTGSTRDLTSTGNNSVPTSACVSYPNSPRTAEAPGLSTPLSSANNSPKVRKRKTRSRQKVSKQPSIERKPKPKFSTMRRTMSVQFSATAPSTPSACTRKPFSPSRKLIHSRMRSLEYRIGALDRYLSKVHSKKAEFSASPRSPTSPIYVKSTASEPSSPMSPGSPGSPGSQRFERKKAGSKGEVSGVESVHTSFASNTAMSRQTSIESAASKGSTVKGAPMTGSKVEVKSARAIFKEYDHAKVKQWLKGLHAIKEIHKPDYRKLVKAKLSGNEVLQLTQKDLAKMGLPFGSQKRFMRALEQFREIKSRKESTREQGGTDRKGGREGGSKRNPKSRKRASDMRGKPIMFGNTAHYSAIDVTIKAKIGEGSFGAVHRAGLYGRERDIVVKISKKAGALTDENIMELKAMADLKKHHNVLDFIGVVTIDEKVCFMTELCELGSLDRLHNKMDLTQEGIFLRVAKDMAKGLAHLHKDRIVHRDLACRNLFMRYDKTIVIGDFGLAKTLEKGVDYYQMPEKCKFPWAWTSPETLRTKKYSMKSDLWSMGVTLWEILCLGIKPYMNDEDLKTRSARYIVAQIIKGEAKLSVSRSCKASPFSRYLFRQCTNFIEGDRLSARSVVETIEKYESGEFKVQSQET